MRSPIRFLTVCAALLAGTPVWADTVIQPQGTFELLSDSAILGAVVGQTIMVPTDGDTNLVSFGFSIVTPDGASFPTEEVAYAYAWNGSEATGPALYASPLTLQLTDTQFFEGNPTAAPVQIFETGGLNLEAGQEYVIFADVEGDFYQSALIAGTGSGYGGGSSVYTQGADPALWTTEAWSLGLVHGADPFDLPPMNFIATFAAPVPEPGTWIMALAGFGAIGLICLATRRGGLIL